MKRRSMIPSVATLIATGALATATLAADLPNIRVLATGGTIAGAQASATDYGYSRSSPESRSRTSAART